MLDGVPSPDTTLPRMADKMILHMNAIKDHSVSVDGSAKVSERSLDDREFIK